MRFLKPHHVCACQTARPTAKEAAGHGLSVWQLLNCCVLCWSQRMKELLTATTPKMLMTATVSKTRGSHKAKTCQNQHASAFVLIQSPKASLISKLPVPLRLLYPSGIQLFFPGPGQPLYIKTIGPSTMAHGPGKQDFITVSYSNMI